MNFSFHMAQLCSLNCEVKKNIFKNEDLYNYFMGCVLYNPTCKAEDFDDSVLKKKKKANLEILASMDTY